MFYKSRLQNRTVAVTVGSLSVQQKFWLTAGGDTQASSAALLAYTYVHSGWRHSTSAHAHATSGGQTSTRRDFRVPWDWRASRESADVASLSPYVDNGIMLLWSPVNGHLCWGGWGDRHTSDRIGVRWTGDWSQQVIAKQIMLPADTGQLTWLQLAHLLFFYLRPHHMTLAAAVSARGGRSK